MKAENLQKPTISTEITPSDYFMEMRNVSHVVKPYIIQQISKISLLYPELSSDFTFYYRKRILSNKTLLRPYIFKVFLDLYEIDWTQHIEIAALVEMVNIATYQSNLAFDNKWGINKQQNKSNQFISSIFSKLVIFDSILDNDKYSTNQKHQLLEATSTALKSIYYGQFIDINELNFRNLELLSSDEMFNNVYRKRCAFIGGSLIEMIATMSSVIANDCNKELFPLLKQFSYHFGLAGQVVNDLGDLTDKGKSYTNKYFDLYNEKITFPIRILVSEIKSLDVSKLIAHCEMPGVIDRIKSNACSYIKQNISIIDDTINALESKGKCCNHLRAIGNILTKSKLIQL